MFEAAEMGDRISAEAYEAELPKLRARLLAAHLELRTQNFPVIIILSGADAAGKGELVHRLNEWLDPRGIATHAFWSPSDEERERPPYWRFWRALPGRGRIGILFGSWYTDPIIRRVHGDYKGAQLDAATDRIAAFEKMLSDDGAVFLKLWLHLPKKEQKKRLKKLEQDGRVAPQDWKHYKLYKRFTAVSERTLRRTETPAAPWHIIEATDRRHRDLTAGTLLLDTLEARLKTARPAAGGAAPASATATIDRIAARRGKHAASILDHVNLSKRLEPAAYSKQLDALQARLSKLAWAAHEKKRSMVLVFEGWDAAGKGSAIRRVTQAIDPRLYRAIGIAAPTDEERAQHYLWRFWRNLPRAGFSTVFDRSWYGRVLVERVEGFATSAEWNRAYAEINEFEEQLTSHGVIVDKFWLHISRAEQLRRFKERQTVAYKNYKITDDDWRNRKKWPEYQQAVDDMIAHCSTGNAPWTLVSGNDKKFARVQILKTIVNRLERVL